jgi:lauroyl/myristoyl acyltransferase
MDTALYWLVRSVVALLQALPLDMVARFGRAAGALVYLADRRHRRVARRNLTMCFGGEKSPAEIEALARENFRRIGESFATSVKTAGMSWDELRLRVEFAGQIAALNPVGNEPRRSIVVAIGHFGNFELYGRWRQYAGAARCATTYRGLRQPAPAASFLSGEPMPRCCAPL